MNKFSGHALNLRKLQASDIRRFIVEHMELCDTISNAVITLNVALRDCLHLRACASDAIRPQADIFKALGGGWEAPRQVTGKR